MTRKEQALREISALTAESAARLRARFISKVQKDAGPDGCWRWVSAKDRAGYGAFSYGGRGGVVLKAHRLSFVLHAGIVPGEMHVLHRCDTPECVAPSHLFLGTPADNSADKVSKGRQARGGDVAGSRLTENEVREIRALLAERRLPQREIAARYGVSDPTVCNIKRGDSWRWLQPESADLARPAAVVGRDGGAP